MTPQPREGRPRKTKGQTSLDFLMTYGWAVLLVVVVVASLFALGVFNAGSFMGPRATGFSQIGVIAWNVNAAGVLSLRLQNFAGMDINVVNIEAPYGTSSFSYDITNVSIPNSKISDTFTVGAISGLAPGQYYTIPLRITYTDINGFNYTETGTISGTVGAGPAAPSAISLLSCGVISSPGHYVLTQNVSNDSTCFTIAADNVTLDCAGHSITGSGSDNGIQLFVSNAMVKNCVISGYDTGIYGSSSAGAFLNNTVNGNNFGIHLYSSSGNSVLNNHLSNNAARGIRLSAGSSDNIISGNTAAYNHIGIQVLSSYNNNVTNNMVETNSVGIDITDSSFSDLVSGNTATNNTNFGIQLEAGATNITISNNNATDNGFGIAIDSSSNNIITSNNISTNSYGASGIYIQSSSNNNSITGNTLIALQGSGIDISSASDSIIADNNVTSYCNDSGAWCTSININSGTNVSFTNNIISATSITGDSGGAGGIWMSSGSDCNFTGNSITTSCSNWCPGISLDSATDSSFVDNDISIINGSFSSGNSNGIYIGSGSGSSVIGNTIAASGSNVPGINIGSSSSNIANNTVSINSHDRWSPGIAISGSDSSVIGNDVAVNASGSWSPGLEVNAPNASIVGNNVTVVDSGAAIDVYLAPGANITLNMITASSSTKGINLNSASDCTATGNMVSILDGYPGVLIQNSSGNLIYDNLLNATSPVWADGSPNSWNTTLDCSVPGANIIGGDCVGGNYWATPDGDGWSQIPDECVANASGICTVNYTINGDNIDYLPLTDLAPGITTFASAVDDASIAYSFNGWDRSPYINVTLTCLDYVQGASCDVTLYCNDTDNSCVPSTVYSGTFQISAGMSYIRYFSNDTAGNTEATKNRTVSIGPLISDCGRIVSPGNYALDRSVSSGGTCFTIAADNVNLDCNGSTITGDGGDGNGIDNSAGYDYTTVKNCNIIGFSSGIDFENGASYGTIINNTASSNGWCGIWIYLGSSNNNITNNNASSNSNGIWLCDSANNNTIANNTVSNSSQYGGIVVGLSTSYNTLASNTVTDNIVGIIDACDSSNNTIYNNFFNNTGSGEVNIQGWGTTSATNFWNTTLSCDVPGVTNIIGGNCMGGNFWSGFSDNPSDCTDPQNGICNNTRYDIIDSGEVDYLPLTNLTP